jgi:hypothetical protein
MLLRIVPRERPDEIKLGKDLRLSAGVRYDWTSEIGDRDNFSPRLALAYSPGTQKSVYRAGFGVFYERLPLGVSERRRLDDGVRVRKVVIKEPSYPDPFRAGQVTEVPSSIFRTAADFQTPYLIQASAAWERQIARRSLLTLEYAFLRGLHLFRVRDVNAPRTGSGLRPDPSRSNVLEVESTGRMDGHALTLTYRGRVGGRVTVTAQYTLARTRNDLPGADSSADLPFELPADNYDLSGEYGRADFDRRHWLNLAALLELPLETRIGAMLSVKSGEPFDVTTGRDDNGDSYARDRPPGVPRNSGRGPGFARLDLRLTKTVRAASPFRGGRRSGGQFQLVADVFNVLNRVNYGQYVGVMTSPFFGRPNVAKDPRRFQFALRYSF